MKLLILLILLLILATHYIRYQIQESGSIFGIKLLEVPNDVKCYFDEDRCDEGDIDMWSVFYFVVSIIAGYIVPNMHLQYIGLAIILEIVMPYVGYSSRYIINPLIATTGYSIGTYLKEKINGNKLTEKYQLVEKY